MKKALMFTLLAGVLAAPAMARNDALMIPLADVLAMPEAQEKLDGSVKFYLAGKSPRVRSLGEDVSNKKTNAFGKSDDTACKWAALSALLAFQEKAKSKGANAVVNIVSFNKRNTISDSTSIECRVGNVVAGVTLKGTYGKR